MLDFHVRKIHPDYHWALVMRCTAEEKKGTIIPYKLGRSLVAVTLSSLGLEVDQKGEDFS